MIGEDVLFDPTVRASFRLEGLEPRELGWANVEGAVRMLEDGLRRRLRAYRYVLHRVGEDRWRLDVAGIEQAELRKELISAVSDVWIEEQDWGDWFDDVPIGGSSIRRSIELRDLVIEAASPAAR